EQDDRLCSAFQRDPLPLLEQNLAVPYMASRHLRDQDAVPSLPRRSLDPRRHVDRVSYHGEVEPSSAPHVACDHRSGVDSDPNLQVALELLLGAPVYLERGLHRAASMLRAPLRSTEHRQKPVPHELVYVATMTSNDRH